MKTILSGLKVLRFKITDTSDHFLCLYPILNDPITCHSRPRGVLAKLIRNQWMVVCLAVMDSSDKSLNPFGMNRPKVHAGRNGSTGQTICHIQYVCVPVDDTKILE